MQTQSQLQQMHVPMQHAQMVHPNPHMGHMGGQLQVNGRFSTIQTHQQSNQSVLLVSNLDQESVSCYDLFILFGVYGNVVRVKILYNKPDNALLQMSDNGQAQTGKLLKSL